MYIEYLHHIVRNTCECDTVRFKADCRPRRRTGPGKALVSLLRSSSWHHGDPIPKVMGVHGGSVLQGVQVPMDILGQEKFILDGSVLLYFLLHVPCLCDYTPYN